MQSRVEFLAVRVYTKAFGRSNGETSKAVHEKSGKKIKLGKKVRLGYLCDYYLKILNDSKAEHCFLLSHGANDDQNV